MLLKPLVIAYIFGGITFPLILFIGVLSFVYFTAPIFLEDDGADDDLSEFDSKEYLNLKLTQLEDSDSTGVKAYKTGWITVTREYHHFVSNAADKTIDAKDGTTKSAYTALYRLVKKKEDKEAQEVQSPTSPTAQMVKTVKKKNRYFAVLKHGNLFLYKNDDQKDVQHVIVLSNNIVTIWPRGLRDGELFTKKTAICLVKRQTRRKSDLPPKSSAASLDDRDTADSTLDILEKGVIPPGNMGFFIYCDTNYEKEDWYFELIKATKRENYHPNGSQLDKLEPSVYANALHFKTADMISLIQTLHSSEGQLQTRWINAAVGRIFLALQDTDFFERVVENKLLKKLAKINRPGFLEEFQVKKIDVGNAAPFISFPKLESLNPDGSLRVSFKFSYAGKLSMQVATKANLNLGVVKNREVSLLLAATVNKLEGPLVISIKPPPSSRIWWTFEKMPDMDLTVEPVVSQRQITYSYITKAIENKFRDAIKDSLVEPCWDDISFFDTSDEFYRGGIWDTKKRPKADVYDADDTEKDAIDTELDGINLDETDTGHQDDAESIVDEEAIGRDISQNADPRSEPSSLRARVVKTKGSFTSVSSLSKKKTDPSVGTAEDQFLADGSYVQREQVRSQDTASDADVSTGTSRGSTMQFISEETAAGKKVLSTGLKKIGKWYNEKNKSPAPPKRDKSYTPPEMISRRRAPSATSEKPRSESAASFDGNESPQHKNAPQPHSFPAEYLYGLDTQKPDTDGATKSMPPSKIPEMKSPYESQIPFPIPEPGLSDLAISSSPKANSLPRRKPVDEDAAIEELSSIKSTVFQMGPASNIGTAAPPELPSRSPPPPLPQRSLSVNESTPTLKSRLKSVPPPLPLRDIEANGLDRSTAEATVETVTDSDLEASQVVEGQVITNVTESVQDGEKS